MTLQAAVKDDLWYHDHPDATVVFPDGVKQRASGVRMREQIRLAGMRGGRKLKK